MYTIAVDAMGADNSPDAIVEGVNLAIERYDDIRIRIYGDEAGIQEHLKPSSRVVVVPTTEVITNEEEPVRGLRRKKDASIVVAANDVKSGEADAMVSAGSTGATYASSLLIIGRCKNIDRPPITALFPTINPCRPRVLMADAGANPDMRAVNIEQFAIASAFYSRNILNVANPTVGLINNGTEEGKGNALTREAYDLLKANPNINFKGNVEPREILSGVVDVLVTDGYTGNIVVKTMEGVSKSLFSLIKSKIEDGGIKSKLGGLLLKDDFNSLLAEFDDEQMGGGMIIGVNAPVMVTHGSSGPIAIMTAIAQMRSSLKSQMVEQISDYFAKSDEDYE